MSIDQLADTAPDDRTLQRSRAVMLRALEAMKAITAE
jgi:hypothetical protein